MEQNYHNSIVIVIGFRIDIHTQNSGFWYLRELLVVRIKQESKWDIE
jgi:hypothetical protein